MRRAIVVVLALGWLFVLTPAAHAKGPTAAVIEGPGLTEPLRVESYEATGKLPSISTVMTGTGGDVLFGDVVRLRPDAPTTELGARFTVTYLMGPEVALTQELYPFAVGGPYSFTPPGQRSPFVGSDMASGWFRGTQELTDKLVTFGAVDVKASEQVEAVEQQATPTQATAGEVATGWWLGGGAAVLAVVALAGVAVSRGWKVGLRR